MSKDERKLYTSGKCVQSHSKVYFQVSLAHGAMSRLLWPGLQFRPRNRMTPGMRYGDLVDYRAVVVVIRYVTYNGK